MTGPQGATGPATPVGTKGSMNRYVAEAVVLGMTGATAAITLDIPADSRILGCQLLVETEIVFEDAGENTWSASFSGGSSEVIGTGIARTPNAEIGSFIYDVTDVSVTDIVLTPSASTFSSGSVRAIVYYEKFGLMFPVS